MTGTRAERALDALNLFLSDVRYVSNASANPAVGASQNPSTPVSPRWRRAPPPAPP
jgi:hypothetical protein